VEVPTAPAELVTGLVLTGLVVGAAPARLMRTSESSPTRARATRIRRCTTLFPPGGIGDRSQSLESRPIGWAAQTGMTGRVLGLVGGCYGAGLASSARVTRPSLERNSAEVGRFSSPTVLSSGPPEQDFRDLAYRGSLPSDPDPGIPACPEPQRPVLPSSPRSSGRPPRPCHPIPIARQNAYPAEPAGEPTDGLPLSELGLRWLNMQGGLPRLADLRLGQARHGGERQWRHVLAVAAHAGSAPVRPAGFRWR